MWTSVLRLQVPVMARLGHSALAQGIRASMERGRGRGRRLCVVCDIAKRSPKIKKRPKLSRVMGRPNSPPPKSAHMQTTFLPTACKFHLSAKAMALKCHMPVLAGSLRAKRGSRNHPPLGVQVMKRLVTPVIAREGIGVDPGSVCTYIRDRGL